MPGSSTTPGRLGARVHAPIRVAFRIRNGVGTRDNNLCEAQWLACAFPYRRFAAVLTDDRARLGADVVSYSFTVSDLHRLLVAGLPAHCERFWTLPLGGSLADRDHIEYMPLSILGLAAFGVTHLPPCTQLCRQLLLQHAARLNKETAIDRFVRYPRELLRSRHRQQGVPGDRQLHRCAVAPVVALQGRGINWSGGSLARPGARSHRRASHAQGAPRASPPAQLVRCGFGAAAFPPLVKEPGDQCQLHEKHGTDQQDLHTVPLPCGRIAKVNLASR